MPVLRRQRPPVRFREAPLAADSPEALALDALVPADHTARVIRRAVEGLDPAPLLCLYAGRGSDAFPPLPLLAVALYQAHEGHHPPSAWRKHAAESIPVRWLLRGLSPSRSAWYDFRDRLPDALLDLAHQAVRAALAEGHTPAGRAAVDGTLVAADSTRHHLLDEQALQRRSHQLDDAGGLHGPPAPAKGFVGKTPSGRARQRRRYSRLQKEMGRRQARNAGKRASKRKPAERVLVSPGGPEAAPGRDKEKVFRPLYNVRFVADLDSPLVLTCQVVAQPNDAGLLGGPPGQAKEGVGRAVEVVLADSAYAGGRGLADARGRGATVYAPWQANDHSVKKETKHYAKERFEWRPAEGVYVCPAGQELTHRGTSRQQRSGTERVELRMYKAEEATCRACGQRGECTAGKGARGISRGEHEEEIEALRERMKGEGAKALYRLRKQAVERINADVKQHRGLRRLSGRGLARARTQVGLVVLAHNLVTLDKLRRERSEGVAVATPSPATG
jgi:transposase